MSEEENENSLLSFVLGSGAGKPEGGAAPPEAES